MPTQSPVSRARVLKRLKNFSNVLDRAIPIPGTRYRFGLDPILGLLPGGGDCLGAVFSAYIIWEAAKAGAPSNAIGKMTFNVIFETLLGVFPVFGDLVDVAWKANVKNVELLEAHLDQFPDVSPPLEAIDVPHSRSDRLHSNPTIAPGKESRSTKGVAVLAIAAIAIVTILAIAGTVAIAQLLLSVLVGV